MQKKLTASQLNQLKKEATRAAQAGGKVLTKYFQKKLNIRSKGLDGLVTQADVQAEKAIIKILSKARPDFSFLAEESGRTAGKKQSSGRWIIDPLDGTTNFVHSFPMFCVSIAAEWMGEVVVGVIYHPILKDMYVAVKGKGAFLNGKRLRVSDRTQLKDSLLSTGFNFKKMEWHHAEIKIIEKLGATTRALRRPGSATLDLAYTARGVFDGFWEQRLNPWDVAAGMLLVTEAGGSVSDFSGKKLAAPALTINDVEIVASNRRLHSSILKQIRLA